jgi:hypothetical protein
MVNLAPAVISLIALVGLPACVLVPAASGPVQASADQPCAKIFWRDVGAADINAAIFFQSPDPQLTKLGYGPTPGATPPRSSSETADLDVPLRSDRSIELSAEYRRQYEKDYLHGVEQWLRARLVVEVRSCPR